MSQPFDRGCEVPAPGKLDKDLGEFWSHNPFNISQAHNLSCYERNRTYLNVEGKNFLDISHITGADSDGDGRCAVPVDIDHDGRVDLLVRQVGGGPLKVFKNNFPQRHWLQVSLRGVESNRLGIGARLVAKVQDRQIVRELYPVNTYNSQAPATVQFGLGAAKEADELTIRWPSGKEQRLTKLAADRHILIREGADTIQTVIPGRALDLVDSSQ